MLNICHEHRGLTLVLHEDSRGGGGGGGTTPYSGWIILCSLSHRKFYDEEEYILGSLLLPFFKDLAQF